MKKCWKGVKIESEIDKCAYQSSIGDKMQDICMSYES